MRRSLQRLGRANTQSVALRTTTPAILASGGGILSTVRATRAATEDQLFASARPRLEALLAEGVTTCEIKSGYGLDCETELRQLDTAAGNLSDLSQQLLAIAERYRL